MVSLKSKVVCLTKFFLYSINPQGALSQQGILGNSKNYRPEGPVGIRFKKQMLITRDMTSGTYDSHMMESAQKKKHFLHMFDLDDALFYEDDFQLQQLCPTLSDAETIAYIQQIRNKSTESILNLTDEDDIIEFSNMSHAWEAFCAINLKTYKQGIINDEKRILAPPNTYMSTQFYKPKYSHIQGSAPSKSESVANGGIQIQVQGGEQLTDIPKDNHYLNLALGVKPYYELPINTLDCLDQEQTIEGFLFKKAKTNNVNNYNLLKSALESSPDIMRDHKVLNQEVFQRYSFTFEDPEYIANLTTGIRPNQIQKLKPQSSTLRFFTQEIEITPQQLSFDECQLLIPKLEVIKVTNKQRKKDLVIRAIVASSPEIAFYIDQEAYLDQPIRLKPGEQVEVMVAFTSETLGLFEALMYMVIDEWVYVSSFNAFVVPNYYDIQPFYVTDVIVNQSVELPLFITNPSTRDTLIIQEIFSTEEDVKLKWPHNKANINDTFSENDESIVSHILIPEGQRKQIANMVFEINRTLDFVVVIHIRTSLLDIIRVPLYYHVHQDFIKFTPTTIDFGLAPLNFDILKIPLYAKSKLNEPLIITDIHLPLSDKRLDFQMVDLGRNNVIKKNKEVFIGFVLLNPGEAGVIETKLIVYTQGQKTNQTQILEVPIVGKVHRNSNLLGQSMDITAMFSKPLVTFDISKHMASEIQNRRKINEPPQFHSELIRQPLIIKNTFNVPIVVKGIVNQNPELKVIQFNDDGKQSSSSIKPLVLKPGESVDYAKIELNTQLLKISQGNKYMSIYVNNTLIPITVSIFDRALLCSWDDQEHHVNLENIPLCTNPFELNFDYVAINDVKQRRLKITNLNPVNITIDSVGKQQLDDLNVYIEKVVDKNGQNVYSSSELESLQSILGPKRTKRVINFTIQPYQTLQFVFQVLAREQKQKFSRIDFFIKDGESQNFQFNYKYHIISGQLTFVPQVLQFNPIFPGITQQKPLIARSTFEVPITVKAIMSNDIRIMPLIQPLVIRPNNKTEFGSLTFDPAKQLNFGGGSLSNSFKNQDFGNIFNFPLINIDPMVQQNIMQIISGLQSGAINPQLNHMTMIHMSKNAPNGGSGMDFQSVMTPQDIEMYRDKQNLWSTQQGNSNTVVSVSEKGEEIATFITIETNVYSNLTLPVRATIKKPILTDQTLRANTKEIEGKGVWVEVIDFGTVQIGSTQSKNIKIVNPTDDPLVVSLFITTNEVYEQIQNLSKNKKDKNSQIERIPQPSDKDYHFQMYCRSKLKEPLSSIEKDELPSIILSQKTNQRTLCQKLQRIINQLQNQTTDEADVLRRRIEGYFKDNYLADLQKEFNQMHSTNNLIKGGKKTLQDTILGQNINMQVANAMNGIGGMWMSFEPELENITNMINQHTYSRPIDQNTLNILKKNFESQKEIIEKQQNNAHKSSWFMNLMPDFNQIYETTQKVLNIILGSRHPPQRLPQNSTQQLKSDKTKRELKYKEPRGSLYQLKNHIMNDILISNETKQLFKDMILITDPRIVTYTGQSFFINQNVQGQVYKVEPRSNLTIKDALLYQPQSVSELNSEMKLILKNNLTLLHSVEVQGSSGTGILEVQRVLKRSVQSQTSTFGGHYVNALTFSGHMYGPQIYQQSGDQIPDYQNLSETTLSNQQLIKERIQGNIFGHKERDGASPSHREVLIKTNYRHGISSISLQAEQDPTVIPFHISQDDLFIPAILKTDQKSEEDYSKAYSENDYDYVEDHQQMLANIIFENGDRKRIIQEIYSRHQQKLIKVQTYQKRVLVLQNTGNLPITFDKMYLEDGTCKSQRFSIENCEAFTLSPGETHWLHIGYQNDFTFAKVKRKIYIESTKSGVIQEFQVEIQLQADYLQVANDLIPLTRFEEWQLVAMKVIILFVAFAGVSFVAKDCFHHIKFVGQAIPDLEEKVSIHEDYSLNQRSFALPISQAFKQGVQGGSSTLHERRDFIAPVLRDFIPNDHVFLLYQQAQDKLMSDYRANSTAGSASRLNSQQLLLKEVQNICSNKKTLVCIQAQKQAIDAEKESRRLQAQRHMTYAMQQQLERDQARAYKEQIAAQQAEEKRAQEMIRAQQVKQEALQNQKKIVSNVQSTSNKQVVQESKDNSIFSDISINDSHQNIQPLKDEDDHQSLKQQQKSLANQQNQPQVTQAKSSAPPKLSKKQQQRLLEQKQAEENFKKLEQERLKREKEEEAQRELRKIEEKKREEKRLRELEKFRQEEEKRAAEIRRQNEAKKNSVQNQREIEIVSAPQSQNQSVVYENETQSPLNISAINPKTSTSQNLIDKPSAGKFNFEQKSIDKNNYQISGVSQIDKKDQSHQLNEHENAGEDSDFLEHLELYKDRQSLRSQNRPVFEIYFQEQSSGVQKSDTIINQNSSQKIKNDGDGSQMKSEQSPKFERRENQNNSSYEFVKHRSPNQVDRRKYTEEKSDLNSRNNESNLSFSRSQRKETDHGVESDVNKSLENTPVEQHQSIDKKPSLKLTKDDLQPFFDSQRIIDQPNGALTQKRERQRSQTSQKSQKAQQQQPNPSPGGILGSSIFSYNPLSIFTSGVGFNQQDQTSVKSGSKINSPEIHPIKSKLVPQIEEDEDLPTDFGLIRDSSQLDSDLDNDNNEEEEEQTSSNLFHVFQKASTIFSKPLFNTQVKANQKPAQYQNYMQVPSNASSYYNQPVTNSTPHFGNYQMQQPQRADNFMPISGYHANQDTQRNIQESEESKEDEIGQSIFSAPQFQESDSPNKEGDEQNDAESLFGGSLFGQALRKTSQGEGNQYASSQEPKKTGSGQMDPWMQQQLNDEQQYYAGHQTNYQNEYQTQPSAAYRRNQQSLYQPSYPGYQAYPQQQPYYQPTPPPGLGFRPHQHHSLYSQYSQGAPGFGAPPGLTHPFDRMGDQQNVRSSGGFSAYGGYAGQGQPQQLFSSQGSAALASAGSGFNQAQFSYGGFKPQRSFNNNDSGSGLFQGAQHNRSGSGSFQNTSVTNYNTTDQPQAFQSTFSQQNQWMKQPINQSQAQKGISAANQNQQIGALIGTAFQRPHHTKNSSSFVKLEDDQSEDEQDSGEKQK